MNAEQQEWFDDHTWHDPQWTVVELLELKGSRTVSVVLPALNEGFE